MPRHAGIIDVQIGRRVTLRRRQLKLSQTALGQALGVSFQQVQKYEKGSNRVPSGRLVQIAQALDVPPTWFFEQPAPSKVDERGLSEVRGIEAFLRSREGMTLALAFGTIKDQKTRRRAAAAITSLIKSFLADKRR